jgi:hypothetical protein
MSAAEESAKKVTPEDMTPEDMTRVKNALESVGTLPPAEASVALNEAIEFTKTHLAKFEEISKSDFDEEHGDLIVNIITKGYAVLGQLSGFKVKDDFNSFVFTDDMGEFFDILIKTTTEALEDSDEDDDDETPKSLFLHFSRVVSTVQCLKTGHMFKNPMDEECFETFLDENKDLFIALKKADCVMIPEDRGVIFEYLHSIQELIGILTTN